MINVIIWLVVTGLTDYLSGSPEDADSFYKSGLWCGIVLILVELEVISNRLKNRGSK